MLPPDSLLGTYRFTGGMELSPFGAYGGSETDIAALLEELKAESEESGKDFIWRKTSIPTSFPLLSYTTVYRNSDQETLRLITAGRSLGCTAPGDMVMMPRKLRLFFIEREHLL